MFIRPNKLCLKGVWLESDFIGATPTRQLSLKVFGLARLPGRNLQLKSQD